MYIQIYYITSYYVQTIFGAEYFKNFERLKIFFVGRSNGQIFLRFPVTIFLGQTDFNDFIKA